MYINEKPAFFRFSGLEERYFGWQYVYVFILLFVVSFYWFRLSPSSPRTHDFGLRGRNGLARIHYIILKKIISKVFSTQYKVTLGYRCGQLRSV